MVFAVVGESSDAEGAGSGIEGDGLGGAVGEGDGLGFDDGALLGAPLRLVPPGVLAPALAAATRLIGMRPR